MNQLTPSETARQTATEWLVKLQSPELTDEQQQAFFAWLEQQPEHQLAYIEAEALWDQAGVLEQLVDSPEHKAPTDQPQQDQPLDQEPAEVKSVARPWYRNPQTIAASVVGLLALLALQLMPPLGGVHYKTAVGEQRQVALEDGSRVHINTNSKLQVKLQRNHRLVRLNQGEAFFDVSSDPKRPFVIETPTGIVRVLGTSFNVRADQDQTTVTVTEGRVAVAPREQVSTETATSTDFQPDTTLTANQQAVVKVSAISDKSTDLDTSALTSWRQGKQIYNSVPFAVVIADLNRYFEHEVQLGDPSLAEMEIIAVLDLHNRAAAIAALESTFNLKAVQKSTTLTLLYPADKADAQSKAL